MRAPGDAVQSRRYAHFCKQFKHETKWVAVFDIDEFVLPHMHGSLRDFLLDSDHCDGIGINWVMFGDGHHKTRPAGSVVERDYQRGQGNDDRRSLRRPPGRSAALARGVSSVAGVARRSGASRSTSRFAETAREGLR